LKFILKKIYARTKKHYNPHHKKIPLYRIRTRILLSVRNIRIKKSNKKLDHKFLGPFRIMEAVEKQAYRLKFSPTYSRIHDVFHISLLEPYYNRKDRASTTPEPIPIEDQDEWAVEQVLATILPQKVDLEEKSQETPQELGSREDSERSRKRKF
jgi:hypothetical protein